MTNAELLPYKATLIQYQPVATAEERVNIGVLLFSEETRSTAWRISERHGRVAAVFPRLDGPSYRQMVRHLSRRLEQLAGVRAERGQDRLTVPAGSFDEVLQRISPTPSSAFHYSSIRQGICTSLQERADELFDEYVGTLESSRTRDRIDDRAIWDSVTRAREFAHIAQELDFGVHISTANLEHSFRAGWMNGVRNVVEPISFDYVKPGDMVEEANRWRGRLAELASGNEFKLTAFITAPPARGLEKYNQARNILRRSPEVREVFTSNEVGRFVEMVQHDLVHGV